MGEQPHLGQLNLGAQGAFKRALFVCSGGMLRSATSAHWAHRNLNWNTRSCGTMDAALPPVHANLLQWAEEIYCMEQHHADHIKKHWPWAESKIKILNVPDIFSYRHAALECLLAARFADIPMNFEVGPEE